MTIEEVEEIYQDQLDTAKRILADIERSMGRLKTVVIARATDWHLDQEVYDSPTAFKTLLATLDLMPKIAKHFKG